MQAVGDSQRDWGECVVREYSGEEREGSDAIQDVLEMRRVRPLIFMIIL
jgi:hypothetical protein